MKLSNVSLQVGIILQQLAFKGDNLNNLTGKQETQYSQQHDQNIGQMKPTEPSLKSTTPSITMDAH